MAIRGVETTDEFFRPNFNIATNSQSNIDVIQDSNSSDSDDDGEDRPPGNKRSSRVPIEKFSDHSDGEERQ